MAVHERGDVLVVDRPQAVGAAGREARTGRPALGAAGERVGVGPQVIELRDEDGAVLVDCLDDAPQSGDEALVVIAVVLRRDAAVGQHRERLHDDQARAAGGAGGVVIACTLARNVILAERHCVRGEDDATGQPLPAQIQRREQQGKARVHGLRAPFSGSGGRIIR